MKNKLDSIQSEVAYSTFHDSKDLKLNSDVKACGSEKGNCCNKDQEVGSSYYYFYNKELIYKKPIKKFA